MPRPDVDQVQQRELINQVSARRERLRTPPATRAALQRTT
jgi:hypothetical protein